MHILPGAGWVPRTSHSICHFLPSGLIGHILSEVAWGGRKITACVVSTGWLMVPCRHTLEPVILRAPEDGHH